MVINVNLCDCFSTDIVVKQTNCAASEEFSVNSSYKAEARLSFCIILYFIILSASLLPGQWLVEV